MGDVSMTALFYGGPADGAEVALLEPIPQVVRMPLDPVLLDRARTEVRQLDALQLAAEYRLELVDGKAEPQWYLRNGVRTVRYSVHVDRRRPADA